MGPYGPIWAHGPIWARARAHKNMGIFWSNLAIFGKFLSNMKTFGEKRQHFGEKLRHFCNFGIFWRGGGPLFQSFRCRAEFSS